MTMPDREPIFNIQISRNVGRWGNPLGITQSFLPQQLVFLTFEKERDESGQDLFVKTTWYKDEVLYEEWILEAVCKGFSSGPSESGLFSGCLSYLGKPPEHHTDHGKEDPSLLATGKNLIIFGESTPSREPSECSLDNPPPFEHMEASGADLFPIDHRVFWGPDSSQTTPRVLNNLNVPPERFLDPLDETTLAVGAVSPDEFESWEASPERRKQLFATFLILDIGLMDQDLQDQAYRINEHMPFTPFDFLPTVIAASPPFLARFH
jgi:hypothetical protein